MAQDPFALAIADFGSFRQTPGELHNPMVQDRATSFETASHAGAIQFYQYVAREVAGHVVKQDARQKICGLLGPASRRGLDALDDKVLARVSSQTLKQFGLVR